MSWDLSCRDWETRLREGRSLVPNLPLHDLQASRAVAVFNKLRLADVTGNPILADACGDWFRDLVRAVFGSMDPVTKQRFIREFFVLVAKKNSKTSYGALLMLVALLLNERPLAPFLMTAPVQETAELAFSQIAGAIRLDPVLDKKLHVREHLKTIVHRETRATLEIITFDPEVATGRKVVGLLMDEVHVLGKKGKAASALRQLRGGMLPFAEAFLVMITTQSEEAPAGIFKSELQKARKVRDGEIRAPLLPLLYELPRSMQKDRAVWSNPDNWHMVTPNLGRSIDIDRLIEGYKDAEGKGDEDLKSWCTQHLNIEIGLALKDDSWAGGEFWIPQGDLDLTLDAVIERSEVITVGVDGGGLDDMLGLCVLGRDKEGQWLHWAHAWLHQIALKRRLENAASYQDFKQDGDLTIADGMGEDIEQLVDIIARIESAGLLDMVGVDPVGIGSIVDALMDKEVGPGLEQDRIVGIPQGYKLAGAIKTVERKLAAGGFVHGAAPMMEWVVGNAKIEKRGNAVLVTKQVSGLGKIDPLMATFNAAALMSMNPQPRKAKFQLFAL